MKYQDKLFTFLKYDGVPWNNNNAEHAIKQFVYYREHTDGFMKEAGLKDYLVLLSIRQTCRYKGVSFLKFLLSRERDVDAFCQGRRSRRSPGIEVYPKGVVCCSSVHATLWTASRRDPSKRRGNRGTESASQSGTARNLVHDPTSRAVTVELRQNTINGLPTRM